MEDTRDIAVEARVLANEAKSRIQGLDEAIITIRTDVGLVRESLAKLKGQAAIFSAIGALLGSGIVGVGLHFLK